MSEVTDHFGVGKSTLDGWIRQLAPNKTSYRELTDDQIVLFVMLSRNVVFSDRQLS